MAVRGVGSPGLGELGGGGAGEGAVAELGGKSCTVKSVLYLALQHAWEGKTAFLLSGTARDCVQLQQGKCGLLSRESLIGEQNRYNWSMQSSGRNKIKPITEAACCFSSVHAVGLLMTGKQMVILRAPHILAHM